MNNFKDKNDRDDEKGSVSLYGMSFARLKLKMTRLTTDQKVRFYIIHKLFIHKKKVIYNIFYVISA